MHLIQQFLFVAVAVTAAYLFYKKAGEIRRNILLGIGEYSRDRVADRWRNVLLLALGQKKMFRNPLVAVLHLFIYAGFIIINLEVLEIVLDGVLGTHRLFLEPLGKAYGILINAFEILAALVLIACVIFLCRRSLVKVKRFASGDLKGWPERDATIILVTEIILMGLFLLMNASDRALQLQQHAGYADTGNFLLSGFLAPHLLSWDTTTLLITERSCWWLHILGIFAFLNYLPWSKHLHIVLAFPNAYYARLDPPGKMTNMVTVQNEVLYAMRPELAPASTSTDTHFGAKDVMQLGWKNLLDAYSCTECGRCTDACPAHQTGKLLSPRKIMMATRDRLEEVGKNITRNKVFQNDGKALLHDYISAEELRACTTCNACVTECPVSISPLEIILELRRSLIMEESSAPQEWNSMFSNIENNFAPWKFSPEERGRWAEDLHS